MFTQIDFVIFLHRSLSSFWTTLSHICFINEDVSQIILEKHVLDMMDLYKIYTDKGLHVKPVVHMQSNVWNICGGRTFWTLCQTLCGCLWELS